MTTITASTYKGKGAGKRSLKARQGKAWDNLTAWQYQL